MPVQDEKPAAKPAAKAAAKSAAKEEESDDDDDDSDDDDEDDSEVSVRGVGKAWKLMEGCWSEGRVWALAQHDAVSPAAPVNKLVHRPLRSGEPQGHRGSCTHAGHHKTIEDSH